MRWNRTSQNNRSFRKKMAQALACAMVAAAILRPQATLAHVWKIDCGYTGHNTAMQYQYEELGWTDIIHSQQFTKNVWGTPINYMYPHWHTYWWYHQESTPLGYGNGWGDYNDAWCGWWPAAHWTNGM